MGIAGISAFQIEFECNNYVSPERLEHWNFEKRPRIRDGEGYVF